MAKKSHFDQYLDKENRLDILKLQKAELNALHKLAKELNIEQYNQLKKNELILKSFKKTPMKMV